MANSTLTAIRNKVRKITRSPNTAQLSTADLDEYVNTFIQYDFPEHLRLFSLKTTHTFYTQPYQDIYPTDIDSFAGVTTNPLYNYKNRFITTHPPVYIAGYEAFFSQDREQFFRLYPFVNTIIDTQLTGDGVTTTFTGVINPPGNLTPTGGTSLLQYKVVINSIDTNNNGIAMVDRPLVGLTYGNNLTTGNLYQVGTEPALPPTVALANNTVNYVTGDFTVTFPTPPAAQAPILADVVPVQVSRPQSICYYDNQFIVRPVPDAVYPINVEAYIRPTELLADDKSPQLEQWWQYIAYGAAKKVFEDRMDLESVQQIMPEFKKQETLVLRRTIVQQTNQRTATIYTEGNANMYGPGWFSSGGNF